MVPSSSASVKDNLATRSDSLWWSGLPSDLAAARPALPGDASADVAIVGAGFTGLWTAYHLAMLDPALRVLVVDAATAGAGASGRNGGWCSALLPVSWDQIGRQYGADAARRFQSAVDQTLVDIESTITREGIEARAERAGYLRVATDKAQVAHLAKELEVARWWGRGERDLRELNGTQARELINAPGILGGHLTPHCIALDPARLVRGLARTVERLGVRLYDDTRVTSVDGGVVETDRGRIRAAVTVLAVEGYAGTIAGGRRRRLPVRSTMVATAPLTAAQWDELGWRERLTFNDARRSLFYAQRTADGRIAFGGRGAPYRFGSCLDERAGSVDRYAADVADVLRSIFPSLADVPITHGWSGVLGMPRDWMPSVTFDRASGLASAGGYSGDGVALSHLAGQTLAHLISGVDSPLTSLPWVGHSSRQWEVEPFRLLGARAGEWLAERADESERRTGAPSRLWGRAFSALTGH